MTHHDPETLTQIVTWVGVTHQLMTTRINQLMADVNLPLPQLSLLNHFSRQPQRGHTVTELASAFQANQPAITKTVQHLLKKQYLTVAVSTTDRRVKFHYITEAGLEAHRQALARILPDAHLTFAHWSSDEVAALHQALFRLKNWLDDHRDTVATPVAAPGAIGKS